MRKDRTSIKGSKSEGRIKRRENTRIEIGQGKRIKSAQGRTGKRGPKIERGESTESRQDRLKGLGTEEMRGRARSMQRPRARTTRGYRPK